MEQHGSIEGSVSGVMREGATEAKKHSIPPGTAETETEQQLWQELRQKDAQILVLQKKLAHFRQWVSSIHARVQQLNPQAIKNSRKLYVGGIPPHVTEDELKQFLNSLMMKTGALTAPGSAILSCKITTEKNYAFVEFRSVEETSNAMAFDGVAFHDVFLKIRRPSNFEIATAIMLGPVTPDPTMDTSQLDICRTVVEDSPNKLFVGGLPCDWSEEQVKDLLTPHGGLRSFNLVMDKTTGKSKGYAFCEYMDEHVVEQVIKALNQRKVGSKTLTVKRALEGGKASSGGGAAASAGASHGGAAAYLLGHESGTGGGSSSGGGGHMAAAAAGSGQGAAMGSNTTMALAAAAAAAMASARAGSAAGLTPGGTSGFGGFNPAATGLFPIPTMPPTPPKTFGAQAAGKGGAGSDYPPAVMGGAQAGGAGALGLPAGGAPGAGSGVQQPPGQGQAGSMGGFPMGGSMGNLW
mmetsp:Transcript_20487/g.44791  ORF Transcript_20487/g.44791 Transcript_20487/m.44791 type:complete len:465 (-) Transcript_20487:1227-2621(-)|eukprot:CAMPEP_0202890394 /NCGR_PEP_ID=MMETSP1392-20130828/807_1 /ASSEMBLY_ACC=CAM_ASM_000868 /TAXON_ID=225041 /ORGANISM="Chlamydomonas chlamydogama, Strain SAG 11-48b" /LENGTH=464 /DNA_ID=CAMNT_0049573951 /DNA_START=146 /DNA_END=1540 /DNA_ORIENTATION=-